MSSIKLHTCPFCHRPAKQTKQGDLWLIGCFRKDCEIAPNIEHTSFVYAARVWNGDVKQAEREQERRS